MRVVGKPVATTPGSIRAVLVEANASPTCIGVIAWMHTFSPAKMWIAGLAALQQPLLTSTRSSTAISPGPRSTWTS